MSIAATARLNNCSSNTVLKLLRDLGQACWVYQDVNLRNLPCTNVQVDELWSFVYSKDRNTAPERKLEAGNVWIVGNPKEELVSTSFIERQNLTLRMSNRRLTRKTNGFSKKIENHAYSLAVHYMYYNFVRIHQTLRVTPAMAAGVTDKLWSLEDMIGLMEWKFKIL